MATVSDVVHAYLREHPGSLNQDIRRELARHGYSSFTKKTLNQLLYGLSPDLVVWRELPDGKRAWSAAVPEDLSMGDEVLHLSTNGAWSK